jgi:WD40 repeat protein
LITKLSRQLIDKHGIVEEAANWAVESWAIVLGKLNYPLLFLEGIWNIEVLEKVVITYGVNIILPGLKKITENLESFSVNRQNTNKIDFHKKRLVLFERIVPYLKDWNSQQQPSFFLQLLMTGCQSPEYSTFQRAIESTLIKRKLPYLRTKAQLPLAHHDHISELAVSTDGKRIFSASWDKSIKIWDIPSLKNIANL